MPYAAALSAHPLAAHAAGEVVGRVLEQLAEPPDLAVLVVSGAHGRQFEQIAAVVRTALGPRSLIGACASGLVAGEDAVVEQPAIALWAGTGHGASTLGLEAMPDGAVAVIGGDLDEAEAGSLVLVLGGPTFPLAAAVEALWRRHPAVAIVGATVAGGARRGDNKLLRGEEVSTSGAVGLVLPPRTDLVVSRGFRPIGVPLVVTSADGPLIRELAGRPILDRLDEVLLGLDEASAATVSRSLHLGQVVDEHLVRFGPGDFAVRQVREVDPVARTLSVDPPVAVGATVQFLGEDAAGADQDLREQLAGLRAAGALALVTDERLSGFHAEHHHDAELVSTVVDGEALIGPACAAVVTTSARPRHDDGPSMVVVLVDPRDAGS